MRLQGAELASWMLVMAGILRYKLCKEVNTLQRTGDADLRF